MFWAILFLAIGVILLIQTVFKIDLPIVRIAIGLFIMYIGFKIIAGGFGVRVNRFKVDKISTETETVFSNSNDLKVRQNDGGLNRKFSTAFGSSTLDLRDLTTEELATEFKIENAFGRTRVLTNPATPIIAQIDSGFASVQVRDQKVGAFGEAELRTPEYKADLPALKLKIEAAFGSVEIE